MLNSNETNSNAGIENIVQLAAAGNADAQYILGLCYFTGDGIEQDMILGTKLLMRAKESGHPKAQEALGFINNQALSVLRKNNFWQ